MERIYKRDVKVSLKIFFKWLRGSEKEYPPEVKWIKNTSKWYSKKIIAEELLTQQEIETLAKIVGKICMKLQMRKGKS